MALSLPRAALALLGLALLVTIAWWSLEEEPASATLREVSPGIELPGAKDQTAAPHSDATVTTTRIEHARLVAIRVVRASDCSPIHGAEVFVVDGRGKVIGSCFSDRNGLVRELPERERAHGVVAWHPDYQLTGAVVRASRIELSMPRVGGVDFRISQDNPIASEWLASCELTIQRSIACEGNPVLRKANFCEESVYLHLGLDNERFKTDRRGVRVPVYLRRNSWVKLWPQSSLPSRMWWMRGAAPKKDRSPGRFGKPSDAEQVDRDATEFTVRMKPEPEHAAILHYARRAGDDGEVWLEMPGTAGLSTATFEERGGVATFKIFGLRGLTYQPTIVFVRDGKERRVECRRVQVKGRVEETLQPIVGGTLHLRIEGAKAATIELGLTRHRTTETKGGRAEFSGLRPGTYPVVAHCAGFRSEKVMVRVRDGEVTDHTVQLKPAAELQILTSVGTAVTNIHVRRLPKGEMKWLYHRAGKDSPLSNRRIGASQQLCTAKGRQLQFPYGDYAVTIKRHKKVETKRVTFDKPVQVVKFE